VIHDGDVTCNRVIEHLRKHSHQCCSKVHVTFQRRTESVGLISLEIRQGLGNDAGLVNSWIGIWGLLVSYIHYTENKDATASPLPWQGTTAFGVEDR